MNGSIRKMMRVTCGMLLMVMSGVSQAAELHRRAGEVQERSCAMVRSWRRGGLSAGRRTRVFMYG